MYQAIDQNQFLDRVDYGSYSSGGGGSYSPIYSDGGNIIPIQPLESLNEVFVSEPVPQVIETASYVDPGGNPVDYVPTTDYLPDSEVQPQLIPASDAQAVIDPGTAATEQTAILTTTTGAGLVEWIKANPLLAGGIGLGLVFYFLEKSKSVMRDKNLPFVIAAAVGLFFLLKRKATSNTDALSTATNSDTPDDLQHQYFNKMSAVLESDPAFANGVPGDFYQAVLTDYEAQQNGQSSVYNNDPVYKTGLPGAFEGVADAWQGAMKFSEATHSQLWQLYNEYRTLLAKQSL